MNALTDFINAPSSVVHERKHYCGGKTLRCIVSAGVRRDRVAIFQCGVCGVRWCVEWVKTGTATELVAVIRRNGQIQNVPGEKLERGKR